MSKEPCFDMLYCDSISGCFVNTFEYGYTGNCPGCGSRGRHRDGEWAGEEA